MVINKRKYLMLLTLFFIFPAPVFSAESAEEVYARYKDHVMQVRILDRSSDVKSSIGSGFAVSAEGHIVTNYHVVAEMVHHPDRYRAEYEMESGLKGELELLNLDVVHDLALLKADNLSGKFFKLSQKEPAKGENLFSLGNPYDLGLTIVEGTYNGLLEKSLYKKIHFTGSINPGMSGGPALNGKGRVVGVNVSTAGNQVSFLVPVKYVSEMLSEADKKDDSPKDFPRIISDQLLENQSGYMTTLLKGPFKSISIGNYSMPGELAPFIKCWGDTRSDEGLLYEKVYQSCNSEDNIYLSKMLSSGAIRFRHELFRTEKLGAIRFYGFLEKHFNQPHLSSGGNEESMGNYNCITDFVEHNGIDSKVVLCLRGYKKLEGLYDSFLTATSLVSDSEALHTTLTLSGVSYQNAVDFSRAYIENISWKK